MGTRNDDISLKLAKAVKSGFLPDVYDSEVDILEKEASKLFESDVIFISPKSRVIAASSGAFGYSTVTTATGTFRTVHRTGFAATDFQLIYGNIAVLAAATESAGLSTYTIKASIRHNNGNYPLTFNGNLTGTVSPGGMLTSDILALEIPAATVFEVLTYMTSSTADWQPNQGSNVSSGAGGYSASDLTGVGAAAVPDANTPQYGPYLITAIPLDTANYRGFVSIGDSIAAGQGDTGGAYQDARSAYGGFVKRAFNTRGGVVVIARESETLQQWLSNTNRWRRFAVLNKATDVLCNLGRNDLNAGTSAAAMKTNYVSLWSTLKNRRLRVHQTTLTPHTNSTNSWGSVAGQTVANSSNEAVRIEINTWLREGAPIINGTPTTKGTPGAVFAGSSEHFLFSVIDVSSAVESAFNSGIWLSSYTADGLHPTQIGHIAMAGVIPAPELVKY